MITDVKVNANKIPELIQVKEVQQQLCDFGLSPTGFQTYTFHFLHSQVFSPPERTAAMTYGMRHTNYMALL